ncbi:ThiF family adenylyltransferase [Candidatus Micrarchaeota archaeon]|nr:ThiF family adenylyltransferase [Candidatus Micrarchaeota archaeon]
MKQIIVVGAGGVGAESLLRLKKAKKEGRLNATIRIIDRDFVDADTLKRQTLYNKADLGRLKAEVAAEKHNGAPGTKPDAGFVGISEHLYEDNADQLLEDADVVMDCTDNWATRCVINQWAIEHSKPWIFTSAIRTQTMATTLTSETACFVCWNPNPATPRSCRVEGISKQTTAVAAQTQVGELITLIQGKPTLAGKLQFTDITNKTCATTALLKNPDCPACVNNSFRLPKAQVLTLCGEREYLFQLDGPIDFKALAFVQPKAKKFGDVMKIRLKEGELVVFGSGRVLVRGFKPEEAQAAVAMLGQKIRS